MLSEDGHLLSQCYQNIEKIDMYSRLIIGKCKGAILGQYRLQKAHE